MIRGRTEGGEGGREGGKDGLYKEIIQNEAEEH